MQKQTRCASHLIAAVTAAVSVFALASVSNAAPADACLKAPQGAAPQGRHWYYRVERPTQRKCWYLAEKGRAVVPAARTGPQARSDEGAKAAPVANVAAAPAASASDAPVADEPKPVITTLVTRNVSNPGEIVQPAATPDLTQPSAVPNSAPDTTSAAELPGAPLVQTPSDQPAAPAIVREPPAPAATAAATASAATETMPTLQLLLGAIALLGFVASGAFFAMALLRRRNDVLNMRREAYALPFEPSPEIASDEGPAFQALRALDPIRRRDLDPMRQHDDVDEILQRMARRRRAA